MNLLPRLLRCGDGSVVVEAALVMPIVFVLLVGIHDFGRAFVDKMEVQHATQAGTTFAFHKYNDTGSVTQGQIEAAAEASTTPLNVSVKLVDGTGVETDKPWCGCPGVDGTGALSVHPVACNATCAAGTGLYVTVIGTASTNPLLLGSTLWPKPAVFPAELQHSITIRLK